jgi:FKBP-type peptidyl-prolyl cis-trans isomerase 2
MQDELAAYCAASVPASKKTQVRETSKNSRRTDKLRSRSRDSFGARFFDYPRVVKIEKGRRVTLKVDLSVAGGQQLEKSTIEFIQGSGTLLPALEAVLNGLEKGAKRDGVLKAKDAFGNPNMQPIKKMKRTEFPTDAKLTVGEKLVAQGDDKSHMNVILQIAKVSGDEVEVRLLHPLAEKDIKYSVEVVNVTDPRPPPMPAKALDLEEEK